MEANEPTNLFHWIALFVPIAMLLFMLVGLRWKSTETGPLELFAAGIISLLLFHYI